MYSTKLYNICIIQYRIIYNNTKNAFDRAEILKTFEIKQYIGFFVIAGLLEPFAAYVRPVNIRPAMPLIRLWH